MKRILLVGIALLFSVWLFLSFSSFFPKPLPSEERLFSETSPVQEVSQDLSLVPSEKVLLNLPVQLPEHFLIEDVPFTVQAPFAEWSDPTFQDACEEASLLMADAWLTQKTLTKESARKGIQGVVAFEKKHFGHAVDTSLEDTAWLFNEYFHAFGLVQTDITPQDIKEALVKNKLVIVPTNGQVLKNPNFTPPGPLRHMLVIVGYDDVTQEFITNDPGTRRGEGYRYPQEVLYQAILHYPTGKHVPTTSTDKVMMTVGEDAALP